MFPDELTGAQVEDASALRKLSHVLGAQPGDHESVADVDAKLIAGAPSARMWVCSSDLAPLGVVVLV
jgi:hypothetical protein